MVLVWFFFFLRLDWDIDTFGFICFGEIQKKTDEEDQDTYTIDRCDAVGCIVTGAVIMASRDVNLKYIIRPMQCQICVSLPSRMEDDVQSM